MEQHFEGNAPFGGQSSPNQPGRHERSEVPLEVSYIADSRTAMRLSRALELVRWRSPKTWGYVAVLPLIIMARHIFDLVTGENPSSSPILGLITAYIALLFLAVAVVALIGAIRVMKVNPQVRLYADTGAQMWARYGGEAMEVSSAAGFSTISYDQIKDIVVIGDTVVIRRNVGDNVAIPRELVPDSAATVLREEFPEAAARLARGEIFPTLPTGEGSQLGRLTGALLLLVAVLLVPSSVLSLVVDDDGTSSSENWQAWQFVFDSIRYDTENRLRLLGAAYALAAFATAVAGALLMGGRDVTRTASYRFGLVAAALACGVTVTSALEVRSAITHGDTEAGYTAGAGFWFLTLSAVVGSTALVVSVVRVSLPHSAVNGRRLRMDRFGAGFLALAGASVITSCFAKLFFSDNWSFSVWHYAYGSHTATPLVGIPLLVGGLVAIVVAAVSLSGRGVTAATSRTASLLVSSLLFGSTLVLSLTTLSHRMVLGFSILNFTDYQFGVGFWMLCAAVAFAFCAVLVSWRAHADATSTVDANGSVDVRSAESMRLARVYDGRNELGHPIANRQPVEPNLRTALLAYLESAPVILAARSFDVDEFAPGDHDVPLNFHTDGSWVWSGSVPYYLNKHGLPPEPELIQHIIARGFKLGLVSDAVKVSAVRLIAL